MEVETTRTQNEGSLAAIAKRMWMNTSTKKIQVNNE